MDQSVSDITQYLLVIQNRLLQILAESYIVAALCFLAIALGCIARLCFAKPGKQRRSWRPYPALPTVFRSEVSVCFSPVRPGFSPDGEPKWGNVPFVHKSD